MHDAPAAARLSQPDPHDAPSRWYSTHVELGPQAASLAQPREMQWWPTPQTPPVPQLESSRHADPGTDVLGSKQTATSTPGTRHAVSRTPATTQPSSAQTESALQSLLSPFSHGRLHDSVTTVSEKGTTHRSPAAHERRISNASSLS
jgi:hypothetical protein